MANLIFVTVILKENSNDNIAIKNKNLQQTTTTNLQIYTSCFSLYVFIKTQLSHYTVHRSSIFK